MPHELDFRVDFHYTLSSEARSLLPSHPSDSPVLGLSSFTVDLGGESQYLTPNMGSTSGSLPAELPEPPHLSTFSCWPDGSFTGWMRNYAADSGTRSLIAALRDLPSTLEISQDKSGITWS